MKKKQKKSKLRAFLSYSAPLTFAPATSIPPTILLYNIYLRMG